MPVIHLMQHEFSHNENSAFTKKKKKKKKPEYKYLKKLMVLNIFIEMN